MFESLGEIPYDVTKDWNKVTKETKQYISLKSMKENLHKVFKIKNDYFAKIFFNYLANRGYDGTKVNYQMFLDRLMPFWLRASNTLQLIQL